MPFPDHDMQKIVKNRLILRIDLKILKNHFQAFVQIWNFLAYQQDQLFQNKVFELFCRKFYLFKSQKGISALDVSLTLTFLEFG